MNTIDRWPYVHLCLVDQECWQHWWRYGMPLRLHYKHRLWTIPVVGGWLADKIAARRWDLEHPLYVNPDPDLTKPGPKVVFGARKKA